MLTKNDLQSLLQQGDDVRHIFRADLQSEADLAVDIVALSNGQGGDIAIGVQPDGSRTGLTSDDTRRINHLIVDAAKLVSPVTDVVTQTFALTDGVVVLVKIEAGRDKPYMTDGRIWIATKTGHRLVTAHEEIARLFQEAKVIYAEKQLVPGSTIEDLDMDAFDAYFEAFEARIGEPVEAQMDSRTTLLEKLGLVQEGQLTVAGTLLFAKHPARRLPVFMVKATVWPGIDLDDQVTTVCQAITGKLSDVYRDTLRFVLAHFGQGQKASDAQIGIPPIVFEALIANALIHRDYFVSAPIRVLIFADRVEIVSPGCLPNNLTVEKIKMGQTFVRNPMLAAFASKMLPCRGIGSGIRRALKAYPQIELIDDRYLNQFKVVIHR